MTDDERPKKLKEVYAEKGLITRSQLKKMSPDEQEKWKEVSFPWGSGKVRGYKAPAKRKAK